MAKRVLQICTNKDILISAQHTVDLKVVWAEKKIIQEALAPFFPDEYNEQLKKWLNSMSIDDIKKNHQHLQSIGAKSFAEIVRPTLLYIGGILDE